MEFGRKAERQTFVSVEDSGSGCVVLLTEHCTDRENSAAIVPTSPLVNWSSNAETRNYERTHCPDGYFETQKSMCYISGPRTGFKRALGRRNSAL